MLRTARTDSARPLKSALSLGNVDDTSLALPSVNQYHSGIERVLEQVQTIRRTKSRHCSNTSGSTSVSPTSPEDDSVFFDDLKSPSIPFSGSVFYGRSKSLSQQKSISRQVVSQRKSFSVKRNAVFTKHQHERSNGAAGTLALGVSNTSRSEPDVGRQLSLPKHSAPRNNLFSSKSAYRTERSGRQLVASRSVQTLPVRAVNGHVNKSKSQLLFAQTEASKMSTKRTTDEPPPPQIKGDSGSNGNNKVADITMKEAVDYLSSKQETYQLCGASFIQHSTFVKDEAKDEVLKLNGILPLVSLLSSPASHVRHTASAALRNLSFKNTKSKEEMERCGGIAKAVSVLRDSDCAETQKQLTGLLWNLSSVDSLKPDLLKNALPVLMERVILPYTTTPDQTSGKGLDPEVFFHATACLRNLSSAKQNNRQALRKCHGLVDSLVSYVKGCVDAGEPDDKSAENCVCILHNLTFQLEAEAAALFSRITASAKPVNSIQGDTGPINCFSSQSRELDGESQFDFQIVEDRHPTGAGWLIHSVTLRSYLGLLGSSQREDTLEACCGALQNLTTHHGIVSSVMSQTIVQKLNGLQVIRPLLKSNKVNVQKNAVALVGNLAKNPQLQSALARKVLPELAAVLTAGTAGGNESDDTLALACQTASCLFVKEPEQSKHLLTDKLLDSLSRLSQNRYFPKASKAASLLLYGVWSEKHLQSFLKKQGMNKSSFVNDVTTAAHKSVQVVD